MPDSRFTLIALAGLVLLFLAGVVSAGPSTVLMQVNQAEVSWGDPDLAGRLERRLTTELGLEILVGADNEGLPPKPGSHYHTDSLSNWGQEAGARYLLLVTVSSERLERKKTFNLPLIFHKYETVGVVEGEIRFYDVMRSRLLLSRPIEFELEAKRAFQGGVDDNKDDPSIHLSAVEKIHFIREMEEKLAEKLTKQVKKVLKKS